MSLREAEHCVITVGEGRGFVARGPNRENLIVTTVECLSIIPSDLSEIPHLLGRLGAAPFLSATCLFVDPISGVAILGPFDPGDYFDFMRELVPLDIAEAKDYRTPAFLLSLAKRWTGCFASGDGHHSVFISGFEYPIADGMSGSPVLDADGRAIGVVRVDDGSRHRTMGGGPKLTDCLPGWFLRM
jgi:hypothetical protein